MPTADIIPFGRPNALADAYAAQRHAEAELRDFFSPEREAERKADFDAGMATLADCRAELRRVLGIDAVIEAAIEALPPPPSATRTGSTCDAPVVAAATRDGESA